MIRRRISRGFRVFDGIQNIRSKLWFLKSLGIFNFRTPDLSPRHSWPGHIKKDSNSQTIQGPAGYAEKPMFVSFPGRAGFDKDTRSWDIDSFQPTNMERHGSDGSSGFSRRATMITPVLGFEKLVMRHSTPNRCQRLRVWL